MLELSYIWLLCHISIMQIWKQPSRAKKKKWRKKNTGAGGKALLLNLGFSGRDLTVFPTTWGVVFFLPYSEFKPWNACPCVCSRAFRCSADQDVVILHPSVVGILFFFFMLLYFSLSPLCQEDLRIQNSLERMVTLKKSQNPNSWLWWNTIKPY